MATVDESELARKFAPTYHWSKGEGNCLVQLDPDKKEPTFVLGHPPWNPYVYFCVRRLGMGQFGNAYEINYLTVWEWDTGLQPAGAFPHQWDIERTAMFVAGPRGSHDPDDYQAYQAYYAAHEGMKVGIFSVDRSDWVPHRAKDVGSEVWSEGREVYWSLGKHASYRSVRKLRSWPFDRYDAPDSDKGVKPQDYELVDVGTLQKPKAEWITGEEPWVPKKVPSARSKLERQLWNEHGKREWRVPKVPKRADIRTLQSELQLEPTGQLDVATLQRIATTIPSDLLWTHGMPEPEVSKVVADYGIDRTEPFLQFLAPDQMTKGDALGRSITAERVSLGQ